jgi:hypothetical protein
MGDTPTLLCTLYALWSRSDHLLRVTPWPRAPPTVIPTYQEHGRGADMRHQQQLTSNERGLWVYRYRQLLLITTLPRQALRVRVRAYEVRLRLIQSVALESAREAGRFAFVWMWMWVLYVIYSPTDSNFNYNSSCDCNGTQHLRSIYDLYVYIYTCYYLYDRRPRRASRAQF